MLINVDKIGSLTRLLRKAFRNYGRSFTIITVLGFIGGLFESLGIASVIPLFYVVTEQAIEGANSITSFILNILQFFHIPLGAVPLLMLMLVLFISKGFVQFIVRYYNAKVVTRFEETFRRVVFRRTLHADWQFLMKQKSGYLETILLYDVERGAATMATLSNIILTGTAFTAYFVIALNISVSITLITLALGAGIFFALKPVFYRIRKLTSEVASAQKDLSHHVAEHGVSMKSIKAMAMENPVVTYANALFARVRQARIRTSFFRQSTLSFIEPLGFLVIVILFLVNWQKPGFDIASFAVIMFLVQRMFTYIKNIAGHLQAISINAPYLHNMMNWRRDAGAHGETDAGEKDFVLKRELRLENVDFNYRQNAPILTGLDLTIPRGHLIGLIGPSGVGKTTVVDLLLRLFEPTAGRITLDGIDAREISLSSWRSHFGYVPQDGVLLNTTIRENIRFHSSDISEEAILTAAKQANIYETVMSLPDQFDAMVGERGVNLSGGQRQRIMLARALARKPDVLILDEATSAIDTESEELIYEAIRGLKNKTTVIVITHRPISLTEFDQVVTLEV